MPPASIDMIIDPQVAARINDIGRLATLPQVTWELMRLLNDEHTTPDDLQAVVEQDPALSAKVISLANSAYYSLRVPATTISRAIIVIGFKELEFLALGLGLADTFDLRKVPYGFDGEGLWLHSLSVSWAARELAMATRAVDPAEGMLAGLLHNLGHVVLVTQFTVQLQRLMDHVQAGHSFQEAEGDLGLWHEVIGYMLAKNWGLPEVLQQVILYHHRPDVAPENSKSVALVSLAVQMVGQTIFGLDYERSSFDLNYLEKQIKLDEETRAKVMDKLNSSLPLMAPTWLQMMGPASRRRK